jgi:eukaryotic-like serine/threonine-protein kinase
MPANCSANLAYCSVTDKVLQHLCRVVAVPELVDDRYETGQEIGRGGMSVVYEARDRRLDRAVALKVLDSSLSTVAPAEAAILARLEHPGIVPVHDAGCLPDGRAYYVMQLVRGQRLDDYLAATGSLSTRVRVFLRICETVGFAHSCGIVHRDLKPQNIMVGGFGEIFVMDWGIEPGGGTPAYMAPEASAGNDVQLDVFSLGRLLLDVMREDHARPLAAIAARASAADPAARYPSTGELAADVLNFLDRLPVATYHETILERSSRFAARNSVLLLLLGSYILVRVG